MTFRRLLLISVAFASNLLLKEADACKCVRPQLCDSFDNADVVLRATALSR